jgi:hypothetical protein
MKTAEQPSPAPSLFQKEYEAFKAAQSTRAAQSTASVVDFGTEREQPAAPAPEVSREELLALIGGNCIIVPLEELDVDDLGLVQEYMETIRIMGDGVGFAKAPVLSTPKVKMPETKAPEYREPLPSSHPAALISYEYKSAEDYKLKQSDKTRLEIFSEEDQTTMVYSLTAGEVLELERLPFNEHGFRPNASGIEDRWRDISLFDAQEWLGEHPRAAESRA